MGDVRGGDEWERILRQARRVIALHVMSGDNIDPAALALDVLRLNAPAPSNEDRIRLEIYIRRQLPEIETMISELQATRAKGG